MPNKNTYAFSARKRLIVVAISACFSTAPAWANPTGPQVVNGSASIAQAGKVLTVTNSNGAIINWQTFSIGASETTRFNQSSAASSVLNRVIANDPSVLLGTLSSNGRVWLVNPAGILVGQGARIDVGGFVASTLNVRNEDFLAGRLKFQATPNAGKVENYGQITTPSGGSVYLVAPNVENHGTISAPNGEVILVAGQRVELVDTGTPGVKVEVVGAEGNATNLGSIVSEAGRIGIAGVLVKNSGSLNASSVVKEGGRVFLKASQDAYVDGAGRIVATGTKGGSIEVLGNRVAVMDQAQLDASGTGGGGTVLVGGDLQGRNPDVLNAQVTYFGREASIKADATQNGDGGKVIVWADDTTRAFGSISARGGANGGDGGFVETSGHRHLDFRASVNTGSPKGRSGTLLLDPADIVIDDITDTYDGTVSSYGGALVFGVDTSGNPAGATFSPSHLTWTSIDAQLGSSNVVVTTNGSGGFGDIGIAASHTYDSGNGLSMLAHRNITASGYGVVNSGSGSIKLMAGWDGNSTTSPRVTPGIGDIALIGSLIQTYGGAISLTAGQDVSAGTTDILTVGTESSRHGGTVSIAGGRTVELRNITTSGYANGGNAGNVAVSSGGAGSISLGNVTMQGGSSGDTPGNGGTLSITATAATAVALGVINADGGSIIGYSSNSTAGHGGGVVIQAPRGNVSVGSISARGGNAYGGYSGHGSSGGAGGHVDIHVGSITSSNIDVSGGYGGNGNDGSVASGNGGAGGSVKIQSNGGVSTGNIFTAGGNAGSYGSGPSRNHGDGGDAGNVAIVSTSSSSADNIALGDVIMSGGDGHTPGHGGTLSITALGLGGSIQAGDIAANGGNVTDQSSGSIAGHGGGVIINAPNAGVGMGYISARGGYGRQGNGYGSAGGAGGRVDVQARSFSSDHIDVGGGDGGYGGSSGYGYSSGGPGGAGGSVAITATGGSIVIAGNVNASGGAGGPCIGECSSGSGGDGGQVNLASSGGTITFGTINASGGSTGGYGQGAGGDITLTADALDLTASSIESNGGIVTLQPTASATLTRVGDGLSGADFKIATTSIDSSASELIIGRRDGTGAIDLRTMSWNTPVTVRSPGNGSNGGTITLSGEQTNPGREFTLIGGAITGSGGIDTSTSGYAGDITVMANGIGGIGISGSLNASSSAAFGGNVSLYALGGNVAAGNIDTHGYYGGGHITLFANGTASSSSTSYGADYGGGISGTLTIRDNSNAFVGNLDILSSATTNLIDGYRLPNDDIIINATGAINIIDDAPLVSSNHLVIINSGSGNIAFNSSIESSGGLVSMRTANGNIATEYGGAPGHVNTVGGYIWIRAKGTSPNGQITGSGMLMSSGDSSPNRRNGGTINLVADGAISHSGYIAADGAGSSGRSGGNGGHILIQSLTNSVTLTGSTVRASGGTGGYGNEGYAGGAGAIGGNGGNGGSISIVAAGPVQIQSSSINADGVYGGRGGYGGSGGTGGTGGSGGNGGDGGRGGAGGTIAITSDNSVTVTSSSITANGGSGGYGQRGGRGGYGYNTGGAGGNSGSGGSGGAGGSVSIVSNGSGGSLTLEAYASVSASGGQGGSGGYGAIGGDSVNQGGSGGNGGNGGSGGAGGSVSIVNTGTGGSLTIDGVNASVRANGGHGGSAGDGGRGGYGGYQGGNGGNGGNAGAGAKGGSVSIANNGTGGTLTIGSSASVSANGGYGGYGGGAAEGGGTSGYGYGPAGQRHGNGGIGGDGGNVSLFANAGALSISGSVSASGGSGGSAWRSSDGYGIFENTNGGAGGGGGNGGTISVSTFGSGSIEIIGGYVNANGGNGGRGGGSGSYSGYHHGGAGGSGGRGGTIALSSGGTITVDGGNSNGGNVTASGGGGGSGYFGYTGGVGGDGGGGGSIAITATGNIAFTNTTVSFANDLVAARGGSGGGGGPGYYSGPGGRGGDGGSIAISSSSGSIGLLKSGSSWLLSAIGGGGGGGGYAEIFPASGGNGGAGGKISVIGSSVTLNSTSILLQGGSIAAGAGTGGFGYAGLTGADGSAFAAGENSNVVIAATGSFTNNAGEFALSVGAGRWLIYSGATDPTQFEAQRGNLDYAFRQYGTAYGGTVDDTRSGFIYSQSAAPVLSGEVTKIYNGDTSANLVGATIGADVDVLNNIPSSASYDNRNVGIGKMVTVSGFTYKTLDTAGKSLYYASAPAASVSAAIGTISKADLVISAATDTKPYDGTITSAGAPTANLATGTVSGGVADSLSAAQAFDSRNAGARTLSVASFTVNDGNGGNNYNTPTFQAATGTIGKADLTISAAADTKTYDGKITSTGTPTASLATGTAPGGLADNLSAAQVFDSRNAGARTLSVSSFTVNDGNGGNNYNTPTFATTAGTITQRPNSTWIGGTTGNWSLASNWDALPDLSNVLAVTVPTGTTVTYDAAVGTTNLASLTTGGLSITGGTLNIANNLTVSSSFSQTGGTLGDFGGGSSASITQATGNLNLPQITVANLNLNASAGAITQSGRIAALTLKTQSQGATTLNNPANQITGGRVDMKAGGPLALWASGDLNLGAIDAGTNSVEIKAGGAILKALGTETSTNIIGASADLASTFGGTSGNLAISADTQVTGALVATVGSATAPAGQEADFGGIRIKNTGAQPASVTLTDNALAGAGVSFLNTGSITNTSGVTLETLKGGDLALLSNGDITWNGGKLNTPSGSVQMSADGSIAVTGALSAPVDLALSSKVAINVSGSVSTGGTGTAAFTAPSVAINGSVNAADDVGIIAETLNLGSGSSTSAGHDAIFAAGNITATNATVSAAHDISVAVTGDLRLNGSGFTAGNDIFVGLLGATSTLYLNDAAGLPRAFLWAQSPSTIHLEFPARTSVGSMVVNGVAVDPLTYAAVAGGSGLFYGPAMTPATAGAGLELLFGTTTADTTVPPSIVNAVVAAVTSSTILSTLPTTQPPLPPIVTTPPPTTDLGGTSGSTGVGGTEGTFGGEAKKDDKEDKDKKDTATGIKKQEDKPTAKKLATCS